MTRNPELSPAELTIAVGNAIAGAAREMREAGPEDARYRGVATALKLAVEDAVGAAAWGFTSPRKLDDAENAILTAALDAALAAIAAAAGDATVAAGDDA